MKLRHAAALALTGWYLMIPPEVGYGPPIIQYQAPLTKWARAKTFDSEKACRKELRAWSTVKGPFDNYAQQRAADRFQRGRCVPADDPRLKEK
jgi:hypothetical protein